MIGSKRDTYFDESCSRGLVVKRKVEFDAEELTCEMLLKGLLDVRALDQTKLVDNGAPSRSEVAHAITVVQTQPSIKWFGRGACFVRNLG